MCERTLVCVIAYIREVEGVIIGDVDLSNFVKLQSKYVFFIIMLLNLCIGECRLRDNTYKCILVCDLAYRHTDLVHTYTDCRTDILCSADDDKSQIYSPPVTKSQPETARVL